MTIHSAHKETERYGIKVTEAPLQDHRLRRRSLLRAGLGVVAASVALPALSGVAQAAPDITLYPTQDRWDYCSKCKGLWYSGNSTLGVCPAGGGHSTSPSYNYSVAYNVTSSDSTLQAGWWWCDKCQGMTYLPKVSTSHCPAGGTHDTGGDGSYKYGMNHNISVSGFQSGWWWCDKCQGMTYLPNVSTSHCPAGGTHDTGGDGSYKYVMAATSY